MTLILSKKNFSLKRLDGKDISDYPLKALLSHFQRASLQWLGDIIRPSNSRPFWDGNMYMWWIPDRAGAIGVYLTEDNEAMFYDERNEELFVVTDYKYDLPKSDGNGQLRYKTL